MAWRLISMVMQGEDGRGFIRFMEISTENLVRSSYAILSCSIVHLEKVHLLTIRFVSQSPTRNEMTEWNWVNRVRGVNGGCKIPSLARLLSGSHLKNSHGLTDCPLKLALLLESFQSFGAKMPPKKNLQRFPGLLVFESNMLTPWHFFKIDRMASKQVVESKFWGDRVLEALWLSTCNLHCI